MELEQGLGLKLKRPPVVFEVYCPMSGSVAPRVKGRRLSVPWNEVMGFRPILYGPRLPALSILVAEFRKVYTFSSTRDHLIPKSLKCRNSATKGLRSCFLI